MDHEPAPRERAETAQRAAADPAISAFVSASAGSGKTKLLTDRLLRLLLAGADPARILCLTYTTAAAAEMALRLRRDLAGLVTAPEPALRARLVQLGAPEAPSERARSLFARVIDLPGGMRIGTIHAFCQSLLRRFPLEADVSPHFRLLAEADAAAALRGAQENVLGDPDPAEPARAMLLQARREAVAEVAVATSLGGLSALARALAEDRERLRMLLARSPEDLAAAIRAAVGASGDRDAILDQAIAWPAEAELRDALQEIATANSAQRPAASASARLDWLARPPEERRAGWSDYAASFFTDKGEPLQMQTLVGQKRLNERPELGRALGDELGRVVALRDAERADAAARLSSALLTLALPMAAGYARAKRGAARLDYADLIERTLALVRDPGAAWVLHKLDGGLDHLLLDEVQDTSPGQWAIAGALVEEFFAGEGARPIPRTVFAVGDRKQSIFSFQGAEPAAFDSWRERLRQLALAAGQGWRDVALDVSFRSTVPVLELVDCVFANPAASRGVVAAGETLHHVADRVGQAGSVELWPLEPRPPPSEPPSWDAPHVREASKGAPQALAERIADWIESAVRAEFLLPSRDRAVRPGDILVLVRRRDDLARAVIRELKRRGVPVAGLDRMLLLQQAAVADLLALCDVLLLPQDDLALACVLTSPLGGLDDDDLIALAPGRSGTLWDELRRRGMERPGWAAAWAFLSALFARVDCVTPHALLVEALGAAGGRARLLARLGPEAAEPIDELLGACLVHAETHPPSLQGFLHWLRGSAAEVKRQPEAEGGLVRLMTVHGAKGLQAPIVILPDTTTPVRPRDELLWAEGSVPIWAPGTAWRSRRVETLREAAKVRDEEEENRLLYVALTRAEDRLVVCGYQTRHEPKPDSWYGLIKAAMEALQPEPDGPQTGSILRRACEQTAAKPDRPDVSDRATSPDPLPGWAGTAPDWHATAPVLAEGLVRLAPSRPAGIELGPVPPSASPLTRGPARFERGRLLHALLQHLPDLPPGSREPAARRYLAQAPGMDQAAQEAVVAELLAVLSAPTLAAAFGPDSRAEVPLVGLVAGQVVGGLIDRLTVRSDQVLIVDYKTNRQPPKSAEGVPVAYLRQMGAYRAVLSGLYPDRPVVCVLVWTQGPLVMELPGALLDGFAPGAGKAA